MIFAPLVGTVIQEVVSKFGVDPTDGAASARARVRRSFNMGNAKFENCEKRADTAPLPGRQLGNRVSQRHAINTMR